MKTSNFLNILATRLGAQVICIGKDYFTAHVFELGEGDSLDSCFGGYWHENRSVNFAMRKGQIQCSAMEVSCFYFA